MALTGRFYSAGEAKRMRLVSNIYADKEALMEAAKKLAAQIAENAPHSVREIKEVTNYRRDKAPKWVC